MFNEKTGYLVNMKLVSDENDIMIITTGGTIIRMHADSISRVMNVKDSLVATVDVAERDDEAETAAPEETVEDVDIAELTEGAEALDEDEGDDTPENDEESVVEGEAEPTDGEE